MIAVTFALPAESSAFVRKLVGKRREGWVISGDIEHRTSNVEHRTSKVAVVHTGVGARECQKRLGAFFKNNRPRILISSGFCGGTNDQISPGDIVIAENFSGAELREKALKALVTVIAGKIFSAGEVIDPAGDRYAIGREHGAVAIDMETETIALMCAAENILMLALRVVSDTPAAPFPAPPNVLFDLGAQRTKFSRLFAHVAREPASAIRLAKFSKQVTKAREKLADALCTVIPAL